MIIFFACYFFKTLLLRWLLLRWLLLTLIILLTLNKPKLLIVILLFEQAKIVNSHFADFEQVKNFSSHFAALNMSKFLVVILLL